MSEISFSKEDLFQPRKERFTAIMTRRKKSKSGKPRYYLYTMDNQNLIICSEYHVNTTIPFRISQNISDFNPESESYLGKIEHSELSNKYTIFKKDGSENKIKIATTRFELKFHKTTNHDREMDITLYSDNEEPIPVNREEFNKIKELYPDLEFIQSMQNIYFKYEGKHCLSLVQIHPDEFLLDIDAPFSIFSGFASSLTTMVKIKGE
ncbi:hypothetical protein TVAG_372340 [Trichomonas vaginalis G3]|uniref:Tubby C-terminal domain-containing protein n=1 Tax=Trichomonas vaginalis (strain ATCC PRA-98 / G3) TaxID=412133 RepID=A2G000_TRIV3|nr:tubby c-terminal domain-like family [Trichomonas vaginalis G3]EAX89522.1 hypothetical protein TVAG_372340 [Trichomonas vaginalis G3]KAI5493353.1 tubby c-terminal domain-like family [Trichomonas vaginalis G3]|eukprot:XP_001302452.1 hypothetical protein [Trichomonas vaginalis G3]